MDIDKIRNYNQKILAVLGTVLLVTATIGLIMLVVTVSKSLFPRSQSTTNSLLSDDKAIELKKDSLRQQIISYQSPRLVDTLNLVYLIPVDVKTLEKSEKIDKERFSDIGKKREVYELNTEHEFYGSFNNLIVYDYKNNANQKVCDYRIIGTDLLVKYFEDEIVIVFTGAEKDTNKDGVVTLDDFKSLFVYSLKDKNLRKIEIKNSTVDSFKFVEKKKDILITFGCDRDADNIYDSEKDPTFIMKYDYVNKSLVPIVDKGLEAGIQKIINKN